AAGKSERADAKPDGKDAASHNPLWQSLALRPDSVRPKLAVSRPGDPDEREADRAAERVMRTAARPSEDFKPSSSSENSREVQRKCAPCEEEEERKVQR